MCTENLIRWRCGYAVSLSLDLLSFRGPLSGAQGASSPDRIWPLHGSWWPQLNGPPESALGQKLTWGELTGMSARSQLLT